MAHLPYETVTLQLRPERPGEADIVLATAPDGFWSITHHQMVGDRRSRCASVSTFPAPW
jgi:hypothetical protein